MVDSGAFKRNLSASEIDIRFSIHYPLSTTHNPQTAIHNQRALRQRACDAKAANIAAEGALVKIIFSHGVAAGRATPQL